MGGMLWQHYTAFRAVCNGLTSARSAARPPGLIARMETIDLEWGADGVFQ